MTPALNRFVCISCHKQRSNQLEDLSKHFQTLTGFTLPDFHEIGRTEISNSKGHYSFGQLIVHLQWGWNSPDETDRKTYYWAIKIRYRYGSWGASAWCLKGVSVDFEVAPSPSEPSPYTFFIFFFLQVGVHDTVVTPNKGTPNKGIFPYLTRNHQNGK